MILALSRPPYDIGAQRSGCNDGTGHWHADQAFTLLREVTLRDWIAYRIEHSDQPLRDAELAIVQQDRFFEVSTD